jgi:CubicO group peptidase (beta-lactamase class C family)
VLIDTIKVLPMNSQPGENFSYSNSGYRVLGKIIEIVSKTSYEDYLRKNVFEPLGMLHSGYDNSETLIKARASGYRVIDGTLVNAPYIDMFVPYAAGGLYSTVGDLYIWDQALNTEELLKNESLDKMFQSYSNAGYGYGWMVHNDKVVLHGGIISGFHSMILRHITNQVTIIILGNIQSNDASQLSWDLAKLTLA